MKAYVHRHQTKHSYTPEHKGFQMTPKKTLVFNPEARPKLSMREMRVKMFPPVPIEKPAGSMFRIWRIEKNNWNGQQNAAYKKYRLDR